MTRRRWWPRWRRTRDVLQVWTIVDGSFADSCCQTSRPRCHFWPTTTCHGEPARAVDGPGRVEAPAGRAFPGVVFPAVEPGRHAVDADVSALGALEHPRYVRPDVTRRWPFVVMRSPAYGSSRCPSSSSSKPRRAGTSRTPAGDGIDTVRRFREEIKIGVEGLVVEVVATSRRRRVVASIGRTSPSRRPQVGPVCRTVSWRRWCSKCVVGYR